MSAILITAADDALGEHLTALLLATLRERGHAPQLLTDAELATLGDAALQSRCAAVEVVIHLNEATPPLTDRDQWSGFRRNVLATRRLIDACRASVRPPRFLLRSAIAVCGLHTGRGDAPALNAKAPAAAVDSYGRQKAECEALLHDAGLDFAILRLGLLPALGYSSFLFEVAADARIEPADPAELALAFANAVDRPGLNGLTVLIGGGAARRTCYRDGLNRVLVARGMATLPHAAFGSARHLDDWMDTTESEALLRYQGRGTVAWPGARGRLQHGLLLAHSRALAAAEGRSPRLLDARVGLTLLGRGLRSASAFVGRRGR